MTPTAKHPIAHRRACLTDQLRSIIRSRKLTPYAVAQAAGVSPSVVSRFMVGERGLTTDSLDAICDVLGLELRETRRGRGRGVRRGDENMRPT